MIGDLFDRLQQLLGTILSFYYGLLDGLMSDGLAYGLAIILLTITINIIVFPLTLKQTRATRAFTAIQPKIKKIQAEYKDDPPEMQRRLMETQREAGATPGGCLLPLLVQMPIWFALFRLLQTPFKFVADPDTGDSTGELVEGAIHAINPDVALGQSLLDADPELFLGMSLDMTPSQAVSQGIGEALPYLVLMLLMVAAQYVQQWHSTYGQAKPDVPGAGSQQMITRIMPLFIGFISYNFPAGLLLYWSTSNLFRLGQQVVIFRMEGRPTRPGATEENETGKNEEDEPTTDPPTRSQPGSAKKRRRRRRN